MKIVYETILQTVFNTLQLIFLQFVESKGKCNISENV